MGAFARAVVERKSAGSADGYPAILSAILNGGRRSKAGATVNRETAFRVSAFLGCIRVISEGIAQVPFKLLREMPSDVSRYPKIIQAKSDPRYDLLYRKPNGWQSSFEFRETMAIHAAMGNAYAFKNVVSIRDESRIAELIPIDSARVTPTQHQDWSITYKVRSDSGATQEFPQEAIWHVRGPSLNGFMGMDMLNLAREALGLAIATEESHAKLHANGVQPSGIYSIEGTLDADKYQKLKEWIEREQVAADSKGSVMILDRNAKFISQTMNGVDAQHLETRREQLREVCRFMRVMPIMLGDADKTATYASAEQMFLAHVIHTLMPWYERIQQSADVNLLTDAERADGYYTKLVEAGLLRGAMNDTANFLDRLTRGGTMVRNEARAKLDLDPLPGLDDPLTPTNMTTDPTGAPAGASTGA
ncbi:MAG: phage portal protein [Curvibacter sp. PD_MW3]|nr:MAG: phage portal protein [Curvibacter sp. PD_MW3]